MCVTADASSFFVTQIAENLHMSVSYNLVFTILYVHNSVMVKLYNYMGAKFGRSVKTFEKVNFSPNFPIGKENVLNI